jgi:hypothetical protein
MNSDEERMRHMFKNAVPALPQPADRVAAVGARVRRTRMAGAAAALTAMALGAGLIVGLPGVLPGRTNLGIVPAGGGASAPSTDAAFTAGCAKPNQQPADVDALDGIAHRLRDKAQTTFADAFTELEITDRVRVYRKPSAEFDSWVRRDFPTKCVELVDVPYSGREIQGIRDRIDADRGYWRKQGIVLNTVSVDVDGTIKIGVDSKQLDKAKASIPSRYATRVVIQEQGAVPPAGLLPS